MAQKTPEILELSDQRLEELIDRAASQSFDATDYELAAKVAAAYGSLFKMLRDKDATLRNLRKLLFGPFTETMSAVVGQDASDAAANSIADSAAGDVGAAEDDGRPSPRKTKREGHGRRKADAYRGAERISVPHETLKARDACPKCETGTLYGVGAPGLLIRITGRAPLAATIYELEKLRCNLCGAVFTAKPAEEIGTEKYDAASAAMIGLLKYGSGLPFNRIAQLQENLEVPLPPATQWDVVHSASAAMQPAYEELVRQAAQGDVLHNDDTTARILEHMGKRGAAKGKQPVAEDEPLNKDGSPRKGLYTSGVVSTCNGRRIALFFSGRKHAGENLADVLRQRAAELEAPIHMCDALARSLPEELQAIVANCLAHGRRKFVEVYDNFSAQSQHVLESLGAVYKIDAEARKLGLSPEERLALHQAKSRPVMDELHEWLKKQLDDRLVEPNSELGKAISYMLRHWKKLTLFLRQAGAPLDNNLCERVLKRAILHRKNSLFFKTQNGARVGDLYMSLIHTCELSGANPFDYLVALQTSAEQLAAQPGDWMPWNYRQTLDVAKQVA